MSVVDLSKSLPEFRLVDAYLQSIDFMVRSLSEESPYQLMPVDYRLRIEELKEALLNLRQSYVSSLKFV